MIWSKNFWTVKPRSKACSKVSKELLCLNDNEKKIKELPLNFSRSLKFKDQ